MNITRAFLILFFTLGFASLAQAHAFLDHADPPVGSMVAAPAQVEVWMSMALMKRTYTSLQVLDTKGNEVDNKDVRISEATMVVSLPKLAPGTYTVMWKALAVCGHKTSGTFPFTVK